MGTLQLNLRTRSVSHACAPESFGLCLADMYSFRSPAGVHTPRVCTLISAVRPGPFSQAASSARKENGSTYFSQAASSARKVNASFYFSQPASSAGYVNGSVYFLRLHLLPGRSTAAFTFLRLHLLPGTVHASIHCSQAEASMHA